MNKGAMTATKLRLVLIICMILIAATATVGFYLAQQKLTEYASEISSLNANAKAGNNNLQTLRTLEQKLDQERDAMTKARSIVAQSQQYLYQDQIVKDLSRIAGNSGVVITQFDFASSTGGTSSGSGSGASASSGQGTATPPASSSSLKSETVNVTIKSPLQYSALMNFIKAIELNPLKMQIASISLTKDEGSAVMSQAFTIQVYVK